MLDNKSLLVVLINIVAALFTTAIYLASTALGIADEPKPIIDFGFY